MAPIGIHTATTRYSAKKGGMAAVALFVLVAAVPVLADTAQEKVVNRLSSETSAAVVSHKAQEKETIAAPLQVRQEREQGTYREEIIRRLAGAPSARARSKALAGR